MLDSRLAAAVVEMLLSRATSPVAIRAGTSSFLALRKGVVVRLNRRIAIELSQWVVC